MQVVDVNSGAPPAAETGQRAGLPVGAFLSGRADDLVVDLLAYAMYVRDRDTRGAEARGAVEQDPVLRYRRAAEAELTTFAYRLFHNQAEEIRIAAVREQLGALPRPPGFSRLVAASMVGSALVGAAALWAAGQDGMLAEMAARVAALAHGLGI